MIRKCGWCNEIMGEKEPLDDTRITHGICAKCMGLIYGEMDDDLFEQMIVMTMEQRDRILAEKGDRV